MADRTLFGDPLPRRFGRLPGQQRGLFDAGGWMDAARDIAAAEGWEIVGFLAGQQVRVSRNGRPPVVLFVQWFGDGWRMRAEWSNNTGA